MFSSDNTTMLHQVDDKKNAIAVINATGTIQVGARAPAGGAGLGL